MDLGRTSFDFDIVPAFESPGTDDDVLIADRDAGTIDFRSNSRELIRTIAARNDECKGAFIHQARMIRQVARNLLADQLPGLHAEKYAHAGIATRMIDADACVAAIEAGVRLLNGSYYDPTGVDLISSRLKPDVVAASRLAFAQAVAGARRAQQFEAAGEHESAIAEWHSVFGAPFPEPVQQSVREAFATTFHGGSVSSTSGRTSSTLIGDQIAVPSRSWSPR